MENVQLSEMFFSRLFLLFKLFSCFRHWKSKKRQIGFRAQKRLVFNTEQTALKKSKGKDNTEKKKRGRRKRKRRRW